ncbi:histidine kinase [Roseivirga pacifica]|uniref:histidine kinase n=1 Tax=Roseivirga pacifica TaxID=1267423 RepID=UPI00227CD935|nr:histidine kinase [Roseivirga pacifica]
MNYSLKITKIFILSLLVTAYQNSLCAFQKEPDVELKARYDSLNEDFNRYFFATAPSLSAEEFDLSFVRSANGLLKDVDKKASPDLFFAVKELIYYYYSFKKDTIMSLTILNETIREAKVLDMPRVQASYLNKKAVEYMLLDAHDSALSNFNKAIYLARQNGFEDLLGYTYNSMAIVYQKMFDFQGAMKRFHQALVYLSPEKSLNMIAVVCSNLGNIHSHLQNGDSVVFYAKKVQLLNEQLESDRHDSEVVGLFMAGAFLKGEYEEVLMYADRISLMISEGRFKGAIYDVKYYLSKTMFALGDKSMAYTLAKEAVDLVRENGYTRGEIQYIKWLIELDKHFGQYEIALSRSETLASVLDSLNALRSEQRLQLLLINNELENRDKDISELNTHLRIDEQRIYYQNLLIVLGSLFSVLLFAVFFVFYRRRVTLQRVLAKEAQSRLLLSQLEPHFVFNAMASIQFYLLEGNNVNLALGYLQKFSRLIRKVLESTRSNLISLQDELDTLNFYLEVHQQRLEDSFTFYFEVNLDDDDFSMLIPPMFIQPFIENAIEYGVKGREKGEIVVGFCQEDDILIVTIDDNGPGLGNSHVKSKDHRSQATQITLERIDVLKKLHKREASFSVVNRQDDEGVVTGVRVQLKLPIFNNPI